MLRNILQYHKKEFDVDTITISFLSIIMLIISIIELIYNIDKSFVFIFISNYFVASIIILLSLMLSITLLEFIKTTKLSNEIKFKIAIGFIGIAIAIIFR
ncbi:MAG: hypothetical protein M1538_03520 [Candidatus Marsarchaeota archaeon]|jgi:hypothetical protein|nr:hypothetical protein [Candidatus Marsarchaeota archaeon]